MYTNAITNPYITYIFVTFYMVHMPQYILHKVLSSDYISKQFQNEISNLRGGPRRMGQDKFRRKSGGAKATQYDPRGSTAIVYFNTVQCSPKFMAIIVASTNIAVPYRYLDTGAATHAHGHA